jgi:putative membrane protein
MEVLKILLLPFTLLISQLGFSKTEGPIKKPGTQTEEKFLRAAANVRLMDWSEGLVACEKSNDAAIKKYGQMMVHDQGVFLAEVNRLAASKEVSLSTTLTAQQEEDLKHLKRKTGEDFNRRFLRMMIVHHRRDLRLFRRATEFEDAEIRTFASKHLSLIQSHLLIAKSLR